MIKVRKNTELPSTAEYLLVICVSSVDIMWWRSICSPFGPGFYENKPAESACFLSDSKATAMMISTQPFA